MNEKKYFKVLEKMETVRGFDNTKTFHFNEHRNDRHNKIVSTIGEGKCIAYFLIDKAHPNGNEIHCVYDNGIIVIYNERTKKLITELIARPRQLVRYWDDLGEKFPVEYNDVMEKAKEHHKKGYNEW
jgi:hypothetical protein